MIITPPGEYNYKFFDLCNVTQTDYIVCKYFIWYLFLILEYTVGLQNCIIFVHYDLIYLINEGFVKMFIILFYFFMRVWLSMHAMHKLTLLVLMFKHCLLRRHCRLYYNISLLFINFFHFLLKFYRLFDVIKI